MIYNVDNSLVIYENNSIVGKKLINFGDLEYVHISLDVNSQMEEHSLPFDVDFFVVSGTGNIKIDSKNYLLSKADLIRVNNGAQRALFTNSNERMEVLVIKSLKS